MKDVTLIFSARMQFYQTVYFTPQKKNAIQ